jgi:hypothetical protein
VFQDSEDNDDYEEEGDTQYIRRRRRKDEKPKLEAVLQALRQVRWTIHDFLVTFIREEDCEGNPIILDRKIMKTAQHRQDYLRNTLNTPKIGSLILQPASIIRVEFQRLQQTQYFQRFEVTADIGSINFQKAFQSIQDTAPTWHGIMNELLQNQRANWSSYNMRGQEGIPESVQRVGFMITSMLCFSRAKKQCNLFPSILDIYLLRSEVKRRVIETLAGLGICHRYHTASTILSDLAQHSKVRLVLITDLSTLLNIIRFTLPSVRYLSFPSLRVSD